MFDQSDWKALESVSKAETERFRGFLASHPVREIVVRGRPVASCLSGRGEPAVLIFAGGWGGPALVYETILALEDRHRMIVLDAGAISRPVELAEMADAVLDLEGIDRVALVGQSLGGILGQVYFRCRPERVAGMVLANTTAPRQKKAKKWALLLVRAIPLSLFRLLLARSLKRLSRTDKSVPEEAAPRLAFKRELTARMFRAYATRKKLLGVLELAFALSAAGDYSREELDRWTGKLRVITSPDDPYHGDVGLFREAFSRMDVVSLPEGYGHVAPQVCREGFFSAIRDFLGAL